MSSPVPGFRPLRNVIQHPRTTSPLTILGLSLALSSLAALAVSNARDASGLRERLATIESTTLHAGARGVALERDFEEQREALSIVRAELIAAATEAHETVQLTARLSSAEARLGSIVSAIDAHASSIEGLSEASASFGPGVLAAELSARDELVDARYAELQALIDDARTRARESLGEIERIDAALTADRDVSAMWRDLVGPVVQIAGDASVGSGVLLRSTCSAPADAQTEGEDGEEAPVWRTPVLTSWHVIRDLYDEPVEAPIPVPVLVYHEDGSIREFVARVVAHDVDLDSALLEIETAEPIENGADLAPRSRIGDVRIFERVYAVGCPLGNDPVPTPGEISTQRHHVDGGEYWMINAPTYIGNSGGGIFDAESHDLIGIFSKIYTHGSLRPTIVPHMGLVTPLDRVYDWLDASGHGGLIPPNPETALAAHER